MKPLKMANDRRNGAVHVTQLNHSTITLSSEKFHSEKQNNFVMYLFILAKVAAKWQLLTLLFRKNKGDNKSQICDFSRYFSCKCDCIGRNFEPCCVLTSITNFKVTLIIWWWMELLFVPFHWNHVWSTSKVTKFNIAENNIQQNNKELK